MARKINFALAFPAALLLGATTIVFADDPTYTYIF